MSVVALAAIAKRRRHIVRQIAKGGDRRLLRRALAYLDAAAALLAQPILKPPRKRITRHILEALRDRGPLTSRQLAPIVCKARGDDPENPEVFAAIKRRIEDALYELKRRGVLAASGKPLRWRAVNAR